MIDKLNHSLQENLITVLAYDKEQGGIVAKLLDVHLMEADYRLVAEPCIDYWKQYDKPPGDHTADLVAHIIEDKNNKRGNSVRRVLRNMIALSDSINTKYVMKQLHTFARMQRIKGAIVDSADKINNQEHLAIEEIEEIWNNILSTQEQNFDKGIGLHDITRVMERLRTLEAEFSFGIPELDRKSVRPMRGTLSMIVAPPGRGKSWALVNVAKRAMLDRHKVVYVTLEMGEEDVVGRLYQSLLGFPTNDDDIEITRLETEMGKLTGLTREKVKPLHHFGHQHVELEIYNHLEYIGKKTENLIVKGFPPNTLTPAGLRAYLDMLDQSGFTPDMVIVDYLGIMKVDPKNLRISMGQNTIELRAISIQRNLAMVSAHQASKAGEEALMVKTTHMAEDFSIVGTADTILTYSCSAREFRYGLGRLFVGKARKAKDHWGLLMTQNYATGQFCLTSIFLDGTYFEYLEDLAAADDDMEARGEAVAEKVTSKRKRKKKPDDEGDGDDD